MRSYVHVRGPCQGKTVLAPMPSRSQRACLRLMRTSTLTTLLILQCVCSPTREVAQVADAVDTPPAEDAGRVDWECVCSPTHGEVADAVDVTSGKDADDVQWGILDDVPSPHPSSLGCRIQGRTAVGAGFVDAWLCPEFQQTFVHHEDGVVLAEASTETGASIWAGGNPCIVGNSAYLHEWWGVVQVPLSATGSPSTLGKPTGNGSTEIDEFVCGTTTMVVGVEHFNVAPYNTLPTATLVEFDIATGSVVRTWPSLDKATTNVRVYAFDAAPEGAIAFAGVETEWKGPFWIRPYVGVAETNGTYRWHRPVQQTFYAYEQGEASDVVWGANNSLYVVVAANTLYGWGTANLVRLDPESGDPIFHMGLPGKHLMQEQPSDAMGGIRLWRRGANGLLVSRITGTHPFKSTWTAEVLAVDEAGRVLGSTELPLFEHPFVSEPAPSNVNSDTFDVAWGQAIYRVRLPLAP